MNTVSLQFPLSFDAKDAVRLISPLLHLGRSRPLVIETTATSMDVTHTISSQAGIKRLRGAIRLGSPALRVEPIEREVARPGTAIELRLNTPDRSLHDAEASGTPQALLAALAGLNGTETVVLQWLLRPTRGPTPERRRPSRERLGEPLDRLSERRKKQAAPLVAAVGRIAVQAASPKRRQTIEAQVLGALRSASRPGVRIAVRLLPRGLVARRVTEATVPWVEWPLLLNVEELVGVLGWPVGVGSVPGLRRGAARVLSPDRRVPRRGAVLAVANDGSKRPIALVPSDRLQHLHVVGPTGSGKSVLLANLILDDIAAGRGCVVVDPKGDLIDDVLARLDRRRVDDVIVFDPADDTRPVGLNLLAHGGDRESVVESVASVLHQLHRAFWGPRTDDLLRAALRTLTASSEPMTLVELPPLLTDASFRRRVLKTIGDADRSVLDYWSWFASLSDGEQAQVTAPLLNKVRAITDRPRLRHVVGQTDGLDLDEVIRRRRILLVRLNTGLLGRDAAQLLGSLLVSRLWQATLRRARVPRERRSPFMVFIDEMQDFLHLPVDVGDMLAQARALGVGLTLAHQHLGQLSTELKAGVLANARSRVMFGLGIDDARTLARELDPHLAAEDLRGLRRFEVALRLTIDAQELPPCTGTTQPLPEAVMGQLETVREASRERWGTDRNVVVEAIAGRRSGGSKRPSVGRERST